tara:strand:- start:140 stop:541 length:402 start_codon:yes stop_codon:yes gene_type:complete
MCQDQYWRLFKYIEGRTFEKVDNLKVVSESAKELARFHRDLNDLCIHNLKEIIPDFHNTIVIFKEFKNTLKSSLKEKGKCIKQINYILGKEKNLYIIPNLLVYKKIPLRLCHNDPKINNFLFDEKLNSICLID